MPTTTTPKTQGERIRLARTNAGLSQSQLAAAIKTMTKSKIVKSLVSQWERNIIQNPGNAHMLALEAITGISANWIVNGTGPREARIPATTAHLDQARLARAIAATKIPVPDGFARAVCGLYDLLGETPSISDELLERLASTLLPRP